MYRLEFIRVYQCRLSAGHISLRAPLHSLIPGDKVTHKQNIGKTKHKYGLLTITNSHTKRYRVWDCVRFIMLHSPLSICFIGRWREECRNGNMVSDFIFCYLLPEMAKCNHDGRMIQIVISPVADWRN